MSIEIKIYPSSDLNTDEYLLFHARAYGLNSYDVFFDLAGLYEQQFRMALDGTFKVEHFNSNSPSDITTYTIDGRDYIENIQKYYDYITLHERAFATTNENTELLDIFGVKLVGAPYRANDNNPMVESYEFNVKRIMHQVKTNLFSLSPANNVDDIYSLKKTGSLILTLSSSRDYGEIANFANDVYKDIQSKSINPNKFEDLVIRNKYISLIESLSELARQRKLEKLFIITNGVEKEITERDYLKVSVSAIYKNDIEVTGEFEGYKAGNNSFEMKSGKSKYYCHIVDNKNLKKVEKLNPFKKTKICVKGIKIKKKTLEVVDISVIN